MKEKGGRKKNLLFMFFFIKCCAKTQEKGSLWQVHSVVSPWQKCLLN